MDDLLIIDKPKGITSFGVIRELRKKLNIRKIGHAGTLDPLATGVMVLGIGKGTKLLTSLVKLDKIYEAEVLLGFRTSTGDLEGDIIEEIDICSPERAKSLDMRLNTRPNTVFDSSLGSVTLCKTIETDEVKNVLAELIGDIELQVPRYSAIKVKGQKLYEKARKGQEFEAPKRIMKIYKIIFHDLHFENNKAFLQITLTVGSGTYIRSIAEEIGKRIGVPSTLSNLRRTKVGEFDIKDAKTLDDFDVQNHS